MLCNFVHGRLAIFFIPFLESRISFVNLIKLPFAGGFALSAILSAVIIGAAAVRAAIYATQGEDACKAANERWKEFLKWIKGPAYDSGLALFSITAGPLGLTIMHWAGVQDPANPTMLYLAFMGIVDNAVRSNITLPLLKEFSNYMTEKTKPSPPSNPHPVVVDIQPLPHVRGDLVYPRNGRLYSWTPTRCPMHAYCNCN